MAHMQISAETIYDSAQRIRRLAHELLELVCLRDKVRRAEARQKARGEVWSARQTDQGPYAS